MRNHFLRAAAGNVSGGSIVTTGLHTYYDLGNTSCYNPSSSPTAVTDLTGNGNNSTYQNTASYGNPTFNSNNGGFVEISNEQIFLKKNSGSTALAFGTGQFTIEFFMNIKSDGFNIFGAAASEFNYSPFTLRTHTFNINIGTSGNARVTGEGIEGSTSTSHIFELNFSTGASFGPPPIINIDSTTQNLNFGWEHFVASRENMSGTGMKFYRNNSLIKTTLNLCNYTYPSAGFSQNSIGENYMKNASHFAIFRIYSGHALTATEVDQNYQAEKARFGLS